MNKNGRSALHYAVLLGKDDISQLLTTFGADIRIRYNQDLYNEKKYSF